eukprot:6200339-Pleurochrysis_carterae.AAC.4
MPVVAHACEFAKLKIRGMRRILVGAVHERLAATRVNQHSLPRCLCCLVGDNFVHAGLLFSTIIWRLCQRQNEQVDGRGNVALAAPARRLDRERRRGGDEGAGEINSFPTESEPGTHLTQYRNNQRDLFVRSNLDRSSPRPAP